MLVPALWSLYRHFADGVLLGWLCRHDFTAIYSSTSQSTPLNLITRATSSQLFISVTTICSVPKSGLQRLPFTELWKLTLTSRPWTKSNLVAVTSRHVLCGHKQSWIWSQRNSKWRLSCIFEVRYVPSDGGLRLTRKGLFPGLSWSIARHSRGGW